MFMLNGLKILFICYSRHCGDIQDDLNQTVDGSVQLTIKVPGHYHTCSDLHTLPVLSIILHCQVDT